MSPAAAPSGGPVQHVIILVHGIRTFGAWQDRLASLIRQAEPSAKVLLYKYGYFGSIAFLIPFLRTVVIRRFRRLLEHNSDNWRDARVDIVAHSFGTYITAWALRGLPVERRPRIHTVILSGSVLRQLFPWTSLDSRQRLAERVVNDCGRRDIWPLIAQLFVLGTGSAGRHGFAGIIGPDAGVVNRYFPFGHSGFFEAESFMESKWLPLLTSNETCGDSDVTPPSPAWAAAIEQYSDPFKLVMLVAPFVFALFVWQQTVTARDRQLADERQARERDRLEAAARNARADAEMQKSKAAAVKAEAEATNAKAEKDREALARVAAEAQRQRELALRLVEQANGKLYRSPMEALMLSAQAARIGDGEGAESIGSNALRIMRIRREIVRREEQQRRLGYSWYTLHTYTGQLPVRFSPDGRFLVIVPQTTRDEAVDGDAAVSESAVLIDNETQRVTTLTPEGEIPCNTKERVSFAGFSSSGKRLLLARKRDVEIYDQSGTPQGCFEFSGPKQSIFFLDLIDGDRVLIVGDGEGNAWAGSPLKRAPASAIVRRNSVSRGERQTLLSLESSSSGKWGALLFDHMKETGPAPKREITHHRRAYLWKIGSFGDKDEDNRIAVPVSQPVLSIRFRPGIDSLIVADQSGMVTVWSIEDERPKLRRKYRHDGHPVRNVEFSADGKTMFTVADDDVLRQWNLGEVNDP